jgi:ABC-type glycerol-3-phosphate transport system substrate-binding protein
MRKLLLILVIGATFTACGGGDSETNTSDTSTIVTQDTAQVVTDTTIERDTINKD